MKAPLNETVQTTSVVAPSAYQCHWNVVLVTRLTTAPNRRALMSQTCKQVMIMQLYNVVSVSIGISIVS